ncbi:MAG TPA: glucodextranase DOMON-like domain-containing protein, partial [Candidatus Ozemobacteraceae bacterium]|nr:glucodextranase DOMON-like domain-containing protein [Candidatus Ozemobacteraceae bacterium]
LFAEGMVWEKMVLFFFFKQKTAYDIIKNKTDEIGFQDMVPDIILPDYVQVQRDRIIVRISKALLERKPSPDWGFQCFAMGFSNVVSPNRLLNMDVKGFATPKDFGGGWDTYGDPPVIDMIVSGDPEDADRRQYEILKSYRSEPYRGEIEYAMVPFVHGREKPVEKAPVTMVPAARPAPKSPLVQAPPAVLLPADEPIPAAKPPVKAPTAARPSKGTVSDSADAGFLPLGKTKTTAPAATSGFVPIRKTTPQGQTGKTGTAAPASGSFQPLKKPDTSGGFMPIRKATPPTDE